jgi:hypothetical protein
MVMASMYIMIERKGNFLWLADAAVLYSTLACLLSFHVIRSVSYVDFVHIQNRKVSPLFTDFSFCNYVMGKFSYGKMSGNYSHG